MLSRASKVAADYLGVTLPEQPTVDDGVPATDETGATQAGDLPGPLIDGDDIDTGIANAP